MNAVVGGIGIVASDCCCNFAAAAVASTSAFDYFLSNKIDSVATHFADIHLAIDDEQLD